MPALRRHLKQITYALIYALILALPVAFFALPALLGPRSPASLAPPPADTLRIESVSTITRPGSRDLIAQIRNPNPRAGLDDFPVTFILLDAAGKELERLTQNSYILPGGLSYLAALDVAQTDVTDFKVELPADQNFVPLPSNISPPTFNSFLRQRTTRPSERGPIEVQRGVITNTSTLGWQRVDITAVAFDSGDNIIGIGRTFIGEFQVGQQREFVVEWPSSPTPIQRVIILPATNVFRADNIFRALGNPAELR